MADRGFTIAESVCLKPAFTKGKFQLDPVDVEKTRGCHCKCMYLRGEGKRIVGA